MTKAKRKTLPKEDRLRREELWIRNYHNKTGHSQLDMLPVILEEVTPENDDFLRLRREELWIRNYQSIEFGANKHS